MIVGGGIGGPVLAMWLRRIGMDVVIAEARQVASIAEGAFLGVAPNGMNVLHGLELAEKVAAIGHACDSFRFSNRKGNAIGQIDRSQDGVRFGWPLTMLRRSQLHGLLLEEAQARGVEVHFSSRLRELNTTQLEIVAGFEGTELKADFLVGCDGLRSTVRGLVFPDAAAPTFSGLLDYGGFAGATELPFPRGVNEMVFGKKAFFGAFTIPTGETWWFHNGPVAQSTGRESLLASHREDPAWISQLIEATPSVLGPWPLHDLPLLKRWSHGRVCLLGDAAHAMSPSAGQGAALAMEDAIVLARCLRDETEPETAFTSYERQRRPRVTSIYKQAQRNGSGKAVSNRVSELFRDLMLPTFLRMGEKGQSRCYANRIPWE